MKIFNFLALPLISFFIFLVYMINSSFMFNSPVFFMNVFYDELSLFIVYMTIFVIFVSFLSCVSFLSFKLVFTIISMLFICLLVFTTRRMFFLYLYYEASLIPILYIIIKWGSYPERSVSSIMLLTYTAIFTFPFVYVLFVVYSKFGSLNFFVLSNLPRTTLFFSLLVFFTFAVKLPIYGLHFWLPIAHVEAPTFGSMILAGVLLKLGGVGLVRFMSLINISFLKSSLFGYFIVFMCYVTLICCFQSDFKRLVAYSSVSHIITIPIIILSSNMVRIKGVISVMFLHGISSPLLFSLVGILYSLSSTRQHILTRGLIISNPFLSLVTILAFFFTLSAPPFPSFISEVLFTVSRLYIWEKSLFFLFFFLFFSIVYNLLWMTSVNFFNQDSSYAYSYTVSFSSFLPLFLSLFLVPLLFTVLFFYVFYVFLRATWVSRRNKCYYRTFKLFSWLHNNNFTYNYSICNLRFYLYCFVQTFGQVYNRFSCLRDYLNCGSNSHSLFYGFSFFILTLSNRRCFYLFSNC